MSMQLAKHMSNELLYVGFNQDYGCFACGTSSGFRIYNCNPFKETFRRDFSSGGIGLVEMLFRCNILALVGGGRNPRYPPDKVMIWDDHQNRCIGELSFRSEVKQVKLRRDRVVVVLQNKIYVYNFADLKLIDHIETVNNPHGLCALSASSSSTVLACPALHRGHVRVELYDIRKTTFISAHETDLACLSLNVNGTRLATASEKGTLIRVYDTSSGSLLQELRRGADKAEIYCIAFNPETTMVATTSDKGTCHIFKLGAGADASADESKTASTAAAAAATTTTAAAGAGAAGAGRAGAAGAGAGAADAGAAEAKAAASNPRSSFSFMKGLLPKYFSSEWSFAQFRVPDTRTICAFGTDPNTILVVGADGSFSRANFEGGGEAKRVSFSRFIKEDTLEEEEARE